MKDGVFVGGRPPTGYKRLPDNRHKLMVDISAAEIVKQIFTWAADGISIYEIVKKLNVSKIPSPKANLSESTASKEPRSKLSGLWSPGTVKTILENEIYLGRLVQGKTSRVNFERQSTPSDEWILCENTHEAIISLELFEAAQMARHKLRKNAQDTSRTKYSANIFKSKIYCSQCGGFQPLLYHHTTSIPGLQHHFSIFRQSAQALNHAYGNG